MNIGELEARSYQFSWLPADMVQPELLEKLSDFYSNHYGRWGAGGLHPGENVILKPRMLKEWWFPPDAHVVWASLLDEIVGYAIAIESGLKGGGTVAWVTQLVVHEEHRKRGVGKRLLFSIWNFTSHVAWGVLSANPYAVRALEKATRRRCSPRRIRVHVEELLKVGVDQVRYIESNPQTEISETESRINTKFFLDHSELKSMVESVSNEETPWALGPLPEGWEWFAFTFNEQPQIQLSKDELAQMLAASDQITQEAFSRMKITDKEQRWTRHSSSEVDFVVDLFGVKPGKKILDFGCGAGRHSIEFAKRGLHVTAVDYIKNFIALAEQNAEKAGVAKDIDFHRGDCRTIELHEKYNFAVCLYDVVGTYAEALDNERILRNLRSQLRQGAKVLLSVMNLELTMQKAKHWFSIEETPDRLLELQSSATMEGTGDIFNPDFYMVDEKTNIVYRKEQFRHGDAIPEEMIVRDRRYTLDQIRDLCEDAGFQVIWARRVRSGNWAEDLPEGSDRAKEILVYCEVKTQKTQQRLFA